MNRSSRPEFDWLSAFLLFLLIQITAARLVTTDWAPFLYFSETVAALGTALGLALGASRLGRRSVIALAIAYTVLLVPWQLSNSATDKLLLDRLGDLAAILSLSFSQFLRRQPVNDSLFFVAFVCVTFWIIALLAGYWLARRGTIVGALSLSGGALIVIQAYADYQPHSSWWLAFYCLIALLLAGRTYYLQSKRDWFRRRVFVSDEAWPSILGSLFVTVGIAVALAWIAPASPAGLHSAADWWNGFTQPIRARLSNAVTSLKGPYGRPGSNFYGSTLAIGQNAATGDTTVFSVEVLQGAGSAPRYYWRGRVYDSYSDGSWSTSPASTVSLSFQPGAGDLKIPDEGGRSLADMRFTNLFPTQSLIYGPSQPVWIDRAARLVASPADAGRFDIFSWESQTAMTTGGLYEVKAEVANPDMEDLRAADAAYPQWITDRYLDVPASLRPELQTLAEQVTSGQSNAFDKATAITAYLRANLRYATSVPAPPEGEDPVAWVLFDYKMGFCNYYASAEVLLLRSIGVPARLAVGFAQGEQQGAVYIVRRRDAHAWPEVYFPGFGWVEFEPTASQPALARPSSTAQANIPSPVGPPARPREGDERPLPAGGVNSAPLPSLLVAPALARVLIVAVPLLVIGVLIYLGRRFGIWVQVPVYLSKTLQHGGMVTPTWLENWISWDRLQPVEQSFASINLSLRWLGAPPEVHATPSERARALGSLLPSASEDIETLKFELESGLFTRQPADVGRARRASFRILAHLLRARLRKILRIS